MAAFDVNGGVSCRAKSQRDKDFNAGYEQGFAQGVKQTSESLANCHQSEIDALKAQVEDLKADAERYQWLKYKATRKQLDYLCYLDIEAFGEKVDVWMNKSIQQQKGEECTVQA